MATRQYSPTLAKFVFYCRILHKNVLFHLVRLGKVSWLTSSGFLANAYENSSLKLAFAKFAREQPFLSLYSVFSYSDQFSNNKTIFFHIVVSFTGLIEISRKSFDVVVFSGLFHGKKKLKAFIPFIALFQFQSSSRAVQTVKCFRHSSQKIINNLIAVFR